MMILPLGLKIYICVILAIFGACMGSFLNCFAIRLCNGESIAKGRSHCMSCGHVLSPLDLIPIFSYIFLRGKCRYCGAKMSPRYLVSEIISAVVYVGVFLRFGWSIKTVEFLLLTSILLCVSFADLEAYIIPDGLIIAGIVIRLMFILFSGDTGHEALQSVIGGFSVSAPVLIIVLIMEKLMKREAMGGGDIKLLFMAGIYLPWSQNLLAILLACICGLLFGAIYNRLKNNEEKLFPFGPAIAAGTYLSMLFGEGIINAYLSLF